MSSRNQASYPTQQHPALEHGEKISVNLLSGELYFRASSLQQLSLASNQYPSPSFLFWGSQKRNCVSEPSKLNGYGAATLPAGVCHQISESCKVPSLLAPTLLLSSDRTHSHEAFSLTPVTLEMGAPCPPRRTQESRTCHHAWRDPLSY